MYALTEVATGTNDTPFKTVNCDAACFDLKRKIAIPSQKFSPLIMFFQVLNPVNDDCLEYADADDAALYVHSQFDTKIKIIFRYAEGPIGYKAASMQRALVKRQKMGLEGGARL